MRALYLARSQKPTQWRSRICDRSGVLRIVNLSPDRLQNWIGLRKQTAHFKRTSEQIVERYGGDVPDERSDLLDLHGVGEYTAASVLAHAHEKDIAAVDTNVARILSRAFGPNVPDDLSATENWKLAERLARPGRCGDYLHALIDFGAAVCTASDLNCAVCPLEDLCEYRTDEGQ